MNFLARLLAVRLLSVGILSVGMVSTAFVGCAPPEEPTGMDAGAEEQPAIEAQKAVAGVGKQGQSLQDHSDTQKIISGPAIALFNFKQKAVLEIQIPQALSLFQATNGRLPKSHEEFMTQIVEANRLQLPELPEGAEYRFNTEKGELWVYPTDDNSAAQP